MNGMVPQRTAKTKNVPKLLHWNETERNKTVRYGTAHSSSFRLELNLRGTHANIRVCQSCLITHVRTFQLKTRGDVVVEVSKAANNFSKRNNH